MQTHEIVSWIRKSLQADDYIDFRVELEGKNSATEGYTSDMVYAKITLAGADRKHKQLNLAIKFGKKTLRQLPMIKEVYMKEIYFYDKVMKVLEDFQNEKGIAEKFFGVPYCYKTYVDDKIEIIILENLSKRGYELHRRDLTMNLQHYKIVFKNLAKFHALSLALRNKNEELFNEIAKHFPINDNILTSCKELFDKKIAFAIENLRESHRDDLADKLEKLLAPGITNKIRETVHASVDPVVIAHFDGHCNNFMFKYEKADKETPIEVAILDWQAVKIHSPAIDLSYFFYSVGSKKELSEQKYLLKFYHDQCSSFLTKLGCNADDVFPFSTLMDHWKKYSFYGFIYACCFMDFNYFDDDDAPNLDDLADRNNIADVLSKTISIKNPDLYRKRLIAIVEHYFDDRFE